MKLETEADALPLSSHSRRRRQLKVEYDRDEGVSAVKTEHWEPPDWKKQLGFIREMRSSRDAPVDHMGAEKCYDTTAPPRVGAENFLCKTKLRQQCKLIVSFFSAAGSGETVSGVGVSHAVQSDQGPGDGSGHAEAPSSRLHCGKYSQH